jgi:hypothetical protein
MKQQPIALKTYEAFSPEELGKTLAQEAKKGIRPPRNVGLAVGGSQVFLCPFDVTDISAKELENRLKLDAIGLLNLPLDDVEFDFQIMQAEERHFRGISVCIPKKILQEYMDVLGGYNSIPIRVTAQSLLRLNDILSKPGIQTGHFCLLTLPQENMLTLVVFHQQRCEMIRVIPYTNHEEAKREIFLTLRAACAQSHVKRFDHIFVSEKIPQKEDLLSDIKEVFAVKMESSGDLAEVTAPQMTDQGYFQINLARRYSLSMASRKKAFHVAHPLILLLILIDAFLGIIIFQKGRVAKSLQSSFSEADYQRALELQKQVKTLQ